MRILVVGAGATGGFFGSALARAGRDVTFLVRPRRAAELRERGLRVIGSGREDVITPRLVTAGQLKTGQPTPGQPTPGQPENGQREIGHDADADDRLAGPYDLVLVSVKEAALAQAVEDFAPAVGPDTAIVPFLNGMAHLDRLSARFGAHAVLGGVVLVATTVTDEGDIKQIGNLSRIVIGELGGGESKRVDAVKSALEGAGFAVDGSADILSAMWRKWAFISTLGALTTLMRASVGDIVAVPGGERLGPAILAESAAVAAAAGHPLAPEALAETVGMVTAPGSPLTASMYRDVAAGRPVEVEHVFGDLVARARGFGIETPLLDLATLQMRVHQARLAREAG